ncbi:MAG: PSD1 and planctomycete cytochrome C domain-containing protein [Verrucomicrobiaceae bacterium]
MRISLVGLFFASALSSQLLAAEPIDFSRDIRPILNAHCTACHGGVKQNGDVSFLFRDQVIAKGKSGKQVVVPGDPDASEMIRRITTTDPDDIMPPPDHGAALPPHEIALVTQWIKEGAIWNNHWSFEKPTRHELPPVSQKDWPIAPLDHFILARLEHEGLTPTEPAEADRLLRRLHVDLTGYPPTIAELDQFAAAYPENPDTAVAQVVDDLLARDSFGEKWATQWLDLARYADSEGLGADRRWNTWPYRDWVIRALNADMPFDQFVKKQIAGDLLPNPSFDDLIATNFHRLTQQNEEGGTDNDEFRTMAVMDRVNTTWDALQGITFGCIQCHDHPYDPIRHEEYYKFLAFFNSTRDLDHGNHYPTLRVPAKTEDYPQALQLKQKGESLARALFEQSQQKIAATTWTKVNRMNVEATKVGSITREEDGYLEFRTKGTIPRNVAFKLDIPKPDTLSTLTAFRVHTLPLNLEKAKHTAELGAVLSRVILRATIPGEEKPREIPLQRVLSDDFSNFYNPDDSLKKGGSGWGAATHQYHPRSAVFVLKDPLALPDGSTLHLELNHNANAPTGPLTTRRGRLELTDSADLHQWTSSETTRAQIRERDASFAAYSKLGAIPLPTMADLPPHLERATHLFERGNWLEKAPEPLLPGTPATLHPLNPAGEKANRLDLANWLTSTENPFTARVQVVRIWHKLFGLGLVETLEDFGSSGLPPSHPALLDDLAVRFQTDMNWSTKALIREILTSATYRQSSKQSSLSSQKDPQNYLLSRGPRNRLAGEHVRDHHLAASGLLTPTLFGPPVRPPIPDGVWKPFNDGPWNAAQVGDPNRYRRAIYTYRKRSIPHPTFSAFDAPTRETCSPRRLVSNTPLAALTVLNDEAFAEMAQALARRMKYDTEGDVAHKITTGFRIATSLKPTPKQLEILTRLFERTVADFEKNPKDFDSLAGTPDGAAYTIVASTILNLDDALTK